MLDMLAAIFVAFLTVLFVWGWTQVFCGLIRSLKKGLR